MDQQITRDAEWLDQALIAWSQQTFDCRANAERAWQQFQSRKKVARAAWAVTSEVVPIDTEAGEQWMV